MDFEQDIREQAYFRWKASGDKNGCADAHWLAAENEILLASMEAVARVMTTPQEEGDVLVLSRTRTKPRSARKVDGRSGRGRNAPITPDDAEHRNAIIQSFAG